jgi:hypothetical protein
VVTGIDDHYRFIVSAKLVVRAAARPVCQRPLLARPRASARGGIAVGEPEGPPQAEELRYRKCRLSTGTCPVARVPELDRWGGRERRSLGEGECALGAPARSRLE